LVNIIEIGAGSHHKLLLFLFGFFLKRVYYFSAFVESAFGASDVRKFGFAAFRTGYGFDRFDCKSFAFGISSLFGVPLFWY
jgi:hypothetical protein